MLINSLVWYSLSFSLSLSLHLLKIDKPRFTCLNQHLPSGLTHFITPPHRILPLSFTFEKLVLFGVHLFKYADYFGVSLIMITLNVDHWGWTCVLFSPLLSPSTIIIITTVFRQFSQFFIPKLIPLAELCLAKNFVVTELCCFFFIDYFNISDCDIWDSFLAILEWTAMFWCHSFYTFQETFSRLKIRNMDEGGIYFNSE